jgi:amylosucrase
MLSQALERRHNIPRGCAWVNYVRSHDDIGWTFADEDALECGKVGADHRRFLNAFFVNRHPGSFARGIPFQDNPRTGDCRISGTAASLAGLESGQPGALERVLLAYSIAMSTGGIPLIYLGDEVGQLNDYGYTSDPARRGDSRWVNRPPYPAQKYAERHDGGTVAGRMYAGFQQLVRVRRATAELAGGHAVGFYTANPHVLGYMRLGAAASVLCLANFADDAQWVGRDRFAAMPASVRDIISEFDINLREAGVHLRAHQYMWLRY